jgi:hypothetical protein
MRRGDRLRRGDRGPGGPAGVPQVALSGLQYLLGASRASCGCQSCRRQQQQQRRGLPRHPCGCRRRRPGSAVCCSMALFLPGGGRADRVTRLWGHQRSECGRAEQGGVLGRQGAERGVCGLCLACLLRLLCMDARMHWRRVGRLEPDR